MQIHVIILELLSALAVFLIGVSLMAEGLQTIAGEKMEEWLKRFTTNVVVSVIAGTIVTAVLDSSSLVIVIVVALVSANVLPLRNAMGVALGANIGTTIGSQIIALHVDEYAAIPLLAGVGMYMLAKSDKMKFSGMAIMGLGLLFYGMAGMDDAVRPLRDHEPFLNWLEGLKNPWLGIAIGGLLTLIIQTSSGTVAIAITMVNEGLLPFAASIAVMLGAEIGTTSDTLIATIGRNRDALRLGLFHLMFNITTVIIGGLAIEPYTEFIRSIGPQSDPGRMLANGHLIFNVTGVLLAMPFIALAERGLRKLV